MCNSHFCTSRSFITLNFYILWNNWLLPEGIIAIISFHSIEDRKVKENFKTNNKLLNLTKKPIVPQDIEIQSNKRSRSAKMRIAKLK